MTKHFIARAQEGKEYIFNTALMIAVPTTRAEEIRDCLNKHKYKINDGQVWYIYDNDPFYEDRMTADIKSVRGGKITIKWR